MRIARFGLMVLILALFPGARGATSWSEAGRGPEGWSSAPAAVSAVGPPAAGPTVDHLKRGQRGHATRFLLIALASAAVVSIRPQLLRVLAGRSGPRICARPSPAPVERSPPSLATV